MLLWATLKLISRIREMESMAIVRPLARNPDAYNRIQKSLKDTLTTSLVRNFEGIVAGAPYGLIESIKLRAAL